MLNLNDAFLLFSELVRIKEKTFWWDFEIIHVPGQWSDTQGTVSVSGLLDTRVVEIALVDTEEITVTINSAQKLMVMTWNGSTGAHRRTAPYSS